MQTWNEARYLFITANPGSGGHRLGRWVSSLPTVYWYNTRANLLEAPIDDLPDFIKGPRTISDFHFQREMEDGRYVPGISDRIFNHWRSFGEWKEMFDNRMLMIHDVDEEYLPWVVHLDPAVLHHLFPRSKIINIQNMNVQRYMETTAKFPYYYKFNGQKPTTYVKRYTEKLEQLHKTFPDMTFEDYWLYSNGYSEWTFNIRKEYVSSVYQQLRCRSIMQHDNVLDVTLGNYKEPIKEFLNV